MRKLIKLLPVGVLAVLLGSAWLVLRNPPETGRRAPSVAPVMTVEAASVSAVPYTVWLDSYGAVRPRTETNLVSQVGGEVITVSDAFRDGGSFARGEVLLEIDRRDYEADLKIAEAAMIDAERAVIEAQAQSDQARADWEKLQRPGEPSPLTLKIPQLKAAQARLISAEASLDRARLDLERTVIRAPYSGRVRQQMVDVGQVISANAVVAEVYATDGVEIRLPVRNRDLRFIELPETDPAERSQVWLRSTIAGNATWSAQLIRTESAIDADSRLLHVIARVQDPFASGGETRPLKMGEYVTARIEGVNLESAIVIPTSTIYQGSFVYLVEEDRLQRREIELLWQNDTDALIGEGLDGGEMLVLTALGQVTSGMKVAIARDRRGVETDEGAVAAVGAASP